MPPTGFTTESSRAALRARYAKPKTSFPAPLDLSALPQHREDQAKDLRLGAYHLAKRMEQRLHAALDSNDNKGLRDLVIAWGIPTDKVLDRIENAGIPLSVPSVLIQNFFNATLQQTSVLPATMSDNIQTVNSHPLDNETIVPLCASDLENEHSKTPDIVPQSVQSVNTDHG